MMTVNISNAIPQVMAQIGTFVKKYGMTGTNTMMSIIMMIWHIIIGTNHIIILVEAVTVKVIQLLKMWKNESHLNIIEIDTDIKYDGQTVKTKISNANIELYSTIIRLP